MVYLWDVRTRKCITQHMDHGCVHGTSLAVSEDSSMYATGSDSGIVNVYSMDGLKRDIDRIDDGTETALSHLPSSSSSNGNASSLSHLPSFSSVSSYHSPVQQSYSKQPLKILTNLTTPVDYIRFNPDSQLMAFASRRKKDALKLLHVPSMTVFSNWPTMQTPLHYVSSVAFSPNSGYLAVGNDRGRVLLYRLKHYPSS